MIAALAGYDVDHLLNRARSPGGSGFIRIEAINSAVNQAQGVLFGPPVREGGEQPGLLRQPEPAEANPELDDLRQACQLISARWAERPRRHQSAGRLVPDARHERR